MTTIRAICPHCGEVTLPSSHVEVQVCAQTQEGSYSFSCPACSTRVSRDADRRVVQILVSGGVRVKVWELPAELYETHRGPSISWDDLLDFHTLLSTDSWFERLQSSIS
jgi:predicted RNA-binding Zn-ribbon protein involved in translation (DUF1610 family)